MRDAIYLSFHKAPTIEYYVPGCCPWMSGICSLTTAILMGLSIFCIRYILVSKIDIVYMYSIF